MTAGPFGVGKLVLNNGTIQMTAGGGQSLANDLTIGGNVNFTGSAAMSFTGINMNVTAAAPTLSFNTIGVMTTTFASHVLNLGSSNITVSTSGAGGVNVTGGLNFSAGRHHRT